MDMKKSVGLRIKALRSQRGISQEEFAQQLDRSVDTISAIERGKSFPSYETLEKLAETLKVPVREFFDIPEQNEEPDRIEPHGVLYDEWRKTMASEGNMAHPPTITPQVRPNHHFDVSMPVFDIPQTQ